MMSSTVDELKQHHANLKEDETASQFDQFVHYTDNLHKWKEEWALCYRRDTVVRANNMNNYAEAGMRILKDNLHKRKEEWALCYRRDTVVRANNTNNYAEAGMRILKDNLHKRKEE